MIIAKSKRKYREYGVYYVPCLEVIDGDYKQEFIKPIDYMHGDYAKADALKWKAESEAVGYIA